VASIISNSSSLTDSGVALIRKAGVSLGNITRTVSNIQSMNQHIAAAVEQQSTVGSVTSWQLGMRRQHFATFQPTKCSPVFCYDETVTLADQRQKAAESPTRLATAERCPHN